MLFDSIIFDLDGTLWDSTEEDNRVVNELGGQLYEGVAVGLQELKSKAPLFIVSNCQSGYIETFLKLTGFENLFTDFECWGNTGQPKSFNLAQVIHRNQLQRPVFVGDTEGDRLAARECHVPFYFVEYGFGRVQLYEERFAKFSELVKHLTER